MGRRTRGPAGPLIRVPKPQPRVLEFESEGDFARVMQQAETVRRSPWARCDPRQRVQVWIQVSNDGRRWHDVEEFWSGYWRPATEGGVPQPSQEDLIAVARPTGFRYARAATRSAV